MNMKENKCELVAFLLLQAWWFYIFDILIPITMSITSLGIGLSMGIMLSKFLKKKRSRGFDAL
jgi:uncharacterized membrane protein YccF (DUF307 family)